MEHEKTERYITATDHWCIYCALEEGVYVDATKIVFDDDDHKALPVCEKCFTVLENPNFFSVFSLN